MQKALLHFRANLSRARELGILGSTVSQITTGAIDLSDMWRAQLVFSVSALDHFVHELTRVGMIEIAKGNRPPTDAFLRYQLPFDAVQKAFSGQPHDEWLGDTIRHKHSWLSFQHPDKIAEAIRFISSKRLWEEVGIELGIPSQDAKLQLELIVDRRNKIAHEADMDPTTPGFRWTMTESQSTGATDYIERIGEAIYKVTT